jgi:hypothetical protein
MEEFSRRGALNQSSSRRTARLHFLHATDSCGVPKSTNTLIT